MSEANERSEQAASAASPALEAAPADGAKRGSEASARGRRDGGPYEEAATSGREAVASGPEAATSHPEGESSWLPPPAEGRQPTLADVAMARRRPTYVFFGVVAALSLFADIGSKAWAEVVLSRRTAQDPAIVLVKEHLSLTLAYNKGGAWGLLHDASEAVRRPFFLMVSLLAIAFIVSLYSRLAPNQRSLRWGLPLVLGGALGNLSDRITRSSVVDFIDYRADWIEKVNALIAKYARGWTVTDHWPTFNVADVFICIGVGLMAVDMITSRRKPAKAAEPPAPPPAPSPV